MWTAEQFLYFSSLNIRARFISVITPTLWNSLPEDAPFNVDDPRYLSLSIHSPVDDVTFYRLSISLLLFFRLVPSSGVAAMVIKWCFAIVFCRPPSFFPVPPFSCFCSQRPSTSSSFSVWFCVNYLPIIVSLHLH